VRSALIVLFSAVQLAAQPAFPSDADIAALARKGVAIEGNAGVVIGLLSPADDGRVVAVADVPYDGRTLFEIGSITKVFTGILLADMAARGEVRLEDPVERLLPAGISVPSRHGRQIRLVDLATHTSGLPRMPDNFFPADPANPYADYSPERLYAFLRGHALTRDIGARAEYSNVGVGLLGHALSLRAGKTYEALVTERILQPLGMSGTRIVLRPEDRARLAPSHSPSGRPVPNWDLDALAGAGALRSSADDMLKFLAANVRPPANAVGRAIQAAQTPRARFGEATQVGLLWLTQTTGFGRTVVWHNGGTAGYRTFIGFDPQRGVGVVVLSNRSNSVDRLGQHLLDPRIAVSVAPIARGFHVLPIALAALLVLGVTASWRRTGATWLRTALVATATTAGAAAWMGLTYVAALFGVLRFDGRVPAMMLLVPLMLALSIGLAVSRFGWRLATGLPLWVLVGFQSFRLPLELLMHQAYEAGLMPVHMSYSGLNFDILTGASAVVVAALVAMGRAGVRAVRAWNIGGSLLLCNIVVVSLLSTPTPLRVFRTQPPNTWVATAPYVWLPAVMVALAILGHIVVYRALKAMSPGRRREGGANRLEAGADGAEQLTGREPVAPRVGRRI
jgi:CubicO group peptidase (beta-lactamase class C family)